MNARVEEITRNGEYKKIKAYGGLMNKNANSLQELS